MIKLSWFSAPALAACLLLAGCFTSEQPLFDQSLGSPLMGTGEVLVTTYENDHEDGGTLVWKSGTYIDEKDDDHTSISFHRLPGTWPWEGWYVGESLSNGKTSSGYIYELYRKRGDKLHAYSISCRDLTDLEAEQTHMARSESKDECKVTRQADLAAALRLLAKRKSSDSYWTWKPAPKPDGAP